MDGMSDTTLDDYQQQSNQRTSDDREISITVYREVWFEFYSWEPDHCQQVISSLSAEAYSFPLVPNLSVEIISTTLNLRMSVNVVADRETSLLVFDSSCVDKFEPSDLTVFQSYPNYEFCTPASRSISRAPDGSEPDDAVEVPFIPYADNSAFKNIEWSRKFTHIAWQLERNCRDPDEEVIQLETVRRLHLGHDFSFLEIDRLKILPMIRRTNESGLLWDNSQRDALNWPGAQLSSFDQLLLNIPSMEFDLWNRMNQMLSSFCPNLNCVQPFCPVHTYRLSKFGSRKPTVTSTSILGTAGDSCGNHCFRHQEMRFQETARWNAMDIEILSSVLKITPDLSPCELAVLCRKPCYEIYVQRSHIIPDDVITNKESFEQGRSRRGTKLKFIDDEYFKYTPELDGLLVLIKGHVPVMLVVHASNIDCTVKEIADAAQIVNGAGRVVNARQARVETPKDASVVGLIGNVTQMYAIHVMQNVLFSFLWWWHGTKFLADRSKKRCRNVEVQRGLSPVIEIKEGKVGLGAFATCDYSVDDFVGDYVGSSNTKDETSLLAVDLIQPKLPNYNFDLNKTRVLDAAKAGNETRYLNHANSPGNNCASKVLLVNGEHRVCLYATKKIAKGEELLLDYGEVYWNDEEPVP